MCVFIEWHRLIGVSESGWMDVKCLFMLYTSTGRLYFITSECRRMCVVCSNIDIYVFDLGETIVLVCVGTRDGPSLVVLGEGGGGGGGY